MEDESWFNDEEFKRWTEIVLKEESEKEKNIADQDKEDRQEVPCPVRDGEDFGNIFDRRGSVELCRGREEEGEGEEGCL